VLIEYLTLIYIFVYFCNAIWLFYQLIIHVCSEANFREKYFSANFSPGSDFQCEASERTYSYVWTSAVLLYAVLASPFLPYTHLYIFIDLSLHVVCFSRGFLPKFWHSLHISSHPMIFIVSSIILLSFYVGIFSWDSVHENPIMSVCWVDIDISGSFGLRSLFL
jgi:hypothetical protein